MKTLAESKLYPYLTIKIYIENNSFEKNAYVDTGLESVGIVIPESILNKNIKKPIKQPRSLFPFSAPNGDPITSEIVEGKVLINGEEFDTIISIIERGNEIIIGRDILDRVKSLFDGPSRILKIYI